MKKSIATFLLFMVCLAQAQSFKYSQKEELEQDLQYWHKKYPDRTKEDIYDELKTSFVSNMYKVESIDALIARMKRSGLLFMVQQIQDVQDTFHGLKIKMQIPHEVELWFIPNPTIVQKDQAIEEMDIKEEELVYDGYNRRVYISPNFLSRVPATRLFQLIHELTHVQQHQRLGLRKFKEESAYDKEHEADTNAISAIKCPVCTQLIVDEWPSDQRLVDFGYLSVKSVEQLKETKKNEDICQAHRVDTEANQQLRILMPVQESWWKTWFSGFLHKKQALDRLNLDWQCSQAAEDRLSTVNFPQVEK